MEIVILVHFLSSNGTHCARVSDLLSVPWQDEFDTDGKLVETQRLHDKMRRSVELWFRRIPAVARDKIVQCCGEMPPVEHRYWTKPHGPDWLWWLATMLPLHHMAKVRVLDQPSRA